MNKENELLQELDNQTAQLNNIYDVLHKIRFDVFSIWYPLRFLIYIMIFYYLLMSIDMILSYGK